MYQTPYHAEYDDHYHSVGDASQAIAEKYYVFLDGVQLPQMVGTISECHVLELGFGTALNFFLTANVCQAANVSLHFVSTEAHLLSIDDFRQLWQQRSVNADLEKKLLELLSQIKNLNLVTGQITFRLSEQITLTLILGPVEHHLNDLLSLDILFDAVYLDGFAPSKNPHMWERNVLKTVYDVMREGGRFATYTAAGEVRRTLQDLGFAVHKIKGFKHKREMMCGYKPPIEAQR